MRTYKPAERRQTKKRYISRRRTYGIISKRQLRIPKSIAEKVNFWPNATFGVESIDYEPEVSTEGAPSFVCDEPSSGFKPAKIAFTMKADYPRDALKVQMDKGSLWIYVAGFLKFNNIDEDARIPIVMSIKETVPYKEFTVTGTLPPSALWGTVYADEWADKLSKIGGGSASANKSEVPNGSKE